MADVGQVDQAIALYLSEAMNLDNDEYSKIMDDIVLEITADGCTPQDWIQQENEILKQVLIKANVEGLSEATINVFIGRLFEQINVMAGAADDASRSKPLNHAINQLYYNIKIYLLTCGGDEARINEAIDKLTMANGPTDNILINGLIHKALTPNTALPRDEAIKMVWGEGTGGAPSATMRVALGTLTDEETQRCIELSKYPLFHDVPLSGEADEDVEKRKNLKMVGITLDDKKTCEERLGLVIEGTKEFNDILQGIVDKYSSHDVSELIVDKYSSHDVSELDKYSSHDVSELDETIEPGSSLEGGGRRKRTKKKNKKRKTSRRGKSRGKRGKTIRKMNKRGGMDASMEVGAGDGGAESVGNESVEVGEPFVSGESKIVKYTPHGGLSYNAQASKQQGGEILVEWRDRGTKRSKTLTEDQYNDKCQEIVDAPIKAAGKKRNLTTPSMMIGALGLTGVAQQMLQGAFGLAWMATDAWVGGSLTAISIIWALSISLRANDKNGWRQIAQVLTLGLAPSATGVVVAGSLVTAKLIPAGFFGGAAFIGGGSIIVCSVLLGLTLATRQIIKLREDSKKDSDYKRLLQILKQEAVDEALDAIDHEETWARDKQPYEFRDEPSDEIMAKLVATAGTKWKMDRNTRGWLQPRSAASLVNTYKKERAAKIFTITESGLEDEKKTDNLLMMLRAFKFSWWKTNNLKELLETSQADDPDFLKNLLALNKEVTELKGTGKRDSQTVGALEQAVKKMKSPAKKVSSVLSGAMERLKASLPKPAQKVQGERQEEDRVLVWHEGPDELDTSIEARTSEEDKFQEKLFKQQKEMRYYEPHLHQPSIELIGRQQHYYITVEGEKIEVVPGYLNGIGGDFDRYVAKEDVDMRRALIEAEELRKQKVASKSNTPNDSLESTASDYSDGSDNFEDASEKQGWFSEDLNVSMAAEPQQESQHNEVKGLLEEARNLLDFAERSEEFSQVKADYKADAKGLFKQAMDYPTTEADEMKYRKLKRAAQIAYDALAAEEASDDEVSKWDAGRTAKRKQEATDRRMAEKLQASEGGAGSGPGARMEQRSSSAGPGASASARLRASAPTQRNPERASARTPTGPRSPEKDTSNRSQVRSPVPTGASSGVITPSDGGLSGMYWSHNRDMDGLPLNHHLDRAEKIEAGYRPIGSIKVGLEVYETTGSPLRKMGFITSVPSSPSGEIGISWVTQLGEDIGQSMVKLSDLQLNDGPNHQQYIIRSNELVPKAVDEQPGKNFVVHDGVWLVEQPQENRSYLRKAPRLAVIKSEETDNTLHLEWYQLTAGEKLMRNTPPEIYFPNTVKVYEKAAHEAGVILWEKYRGHECPVTIKRAEIYSDKKYKPAFNRYVTLVMRDYVGHSVREAERLLHQSEKEEHGQALTDWLPEDTIESMYTGHRPQLVHQLSQ